MSKMKKCSSCEKEVAKSAKVCPHCGQKLKMGFMMKLGIVIVAIIALATAFSMSDEEIQDKVTQIQNTPSSDLSPSGDLANMFSMISDSTDIQRDNKEKEITGKVVQWSLPVFDVNVQSEERNTYRIQTSGSDQVGTFVTLYARDAAEAAKIEALKPNDMITVKGEISGIFMRNIQIDYATLVQ